MRAGALENSSQHADEDPPEIVDVRRTFEGPALINLPPFSACPGCGYTLNPPKSDGRCPECGMSLSDKTVIFRPTPKIRRVAIWLLTLFGVAWVVQLFSTTLGATIVSPPTALIGIGILFLVAAILVIREAFPSERRRPTLILTHDTVTLIHGDERRQIAFDQIKGAERFNIYPEISLTAGRPVSLIGIFDDNNEWLTFAELLIQFKNGRLDGITESIENSSRPRSHTSGLSTDGQDPGSPARCCNNAPDCSPPSASLDLQSHTAC